MGLRGSWIAQILGLKCAGSILKTSHLNPFHLAVNAAGPVSILEGKRRRWLEKLPEQTITLLPAGSGGREDV